jgi:hypothetical protein
MRRLVLLLSISGLGCDGKDTSDGVTVDCGERSDDALCTAWLLSEDGSPVVGPGTPTDVNAVVLTGDTWIVSASGLPSYTIQFSDADIAALDARPLAEDDFVDGATHATAGTVYDWGSDIGYESAASGCEAGAGFGWWPPGPGCPQAADKTLVLPSEPAPASADEVCELGLGAVGWWINGVSIYNWSDGHTFDAVGQWRNIAQIQEIYDMGPCGGHAANGDYHHHTYSSCLAAEADDTGDGHSPIYGFAGDGYPVHGPHHDADRLSSSCWMVRDYDDIEDLTGCGGTSERSCVMVDPYEPGAGTQAASAPGPNTSEMVTSLSGNTFSGAAALYYEDHYFSAPCAAAGGERLDEHNGHDHDGHGYHYHVTYSFPYMPGPSLYGQVVDDSIGCDGPQQGPPGGGGDPPPGGRAH